MNHWIATGIAAMIFGFSSIKWFNPCWLRHDWRKKYYLKRRCARCGRRQTMRGGTWFNVN
jgi:hypothetical protein